MLPRVDLDDLSAGALKALVSRLMERIAGLEHTVAALREEIARLKGLKGPPSIKPSGMEQASEDAPPTWSMPICRRTSTRSRTGSWYNQSPGGLWTGMCCG